MDSLTEQKVEDEGNEPIPYPSKALLWGLAIVIAVTAVAGGVLLAPTLHGAD